MDVALNDAGNAVAALVVRQFTSCRIEHQLLAQVFDLVCGQHGAVDESRSTGRNAAATHCVGDGEQAIAANVVGRRAA
jgi:hypothetical protein